MVEPIHAGELLPAVGALGGGLTITATVPGNDVQPPDVMVTLYVPLIATVADEIVGFCVVDVYAAGPVQLYVAPLAVGVVKFIAEPTHTGELLPAVGVAGSGFITTAVVPANDVQPVVVLVIVTLYVPAIAAVDEAMVGVREVDV